MELRVLQSFPHKIGAGRICSIAWEQAAGVARAGCDVKVMAGAVHRPLPPDVPVSTTLARGRWRIPYRGIGKLRALELHDRLVARALPKLAGSIDLVHAWPLGAVHTLRAARGLGISTALERPNAHTRFAYEAVGRESERLGVRLPRGYEHAYDPVRLRKEEEEYLLADYLLCPSEFVVQTFRDQGFPDEKLVRHTYGFNELRFHAPLERAEGRVGLSALFVGVCAVRKGLHIALEAWLRSPASRAGTFRIAGEFLPEYQRRLAGMLSHPSVQVLGHRDDVAELMRESDILMLPSIEEGFALTCVEAMASGSVPLVSEACTDVCRHKQNAFRHAVGDVDALTRQITVLHEDRHLLANMRAACIRGAPEHTWTVAGRRLADAYRFIVGGAEAVGLPERLDAVATVS